jgi:hypothetical protein
MGTIRSGLLILVLVALALSPAPAEPPFPPDPHQPMRALDVCIDCHVYDNRTLVPHEFVVAIPEKCEECHSKKALGRSHPIGVDPRFSPPNVVTVPEELPLEGGKVSCGSCHNPHLPQLAQIKSYKDQAATFIQIDGRSEIPWYKTFYLRLSDPVTGFEPLCRACHRDY